MVSSLSTNKLLRLKRRKGWVLQKGFPFCADTLFFYREGVEKSVRLRYNAVLIWRIG